MDKLLNYYQAELKILERDLKNLVNESQGMSKNDLGSIKKPEIRYLLETAAFMNARIHKKLADHFPEMSKTFLEQIAPHCLRDLPGSSLIKLEPKADLNKILTIPKHTVFETINSTRQYQLQNCYDFELLPLRITQISFVHDELKQKSNICLKIDFETLQPETSLAEIGLSKIPFFIQATTPYSEMLYEILMSKSEAIMVSYEGRHYSLDRSENLTSPGFIHIGKMLPYSPNTNMVYRLLLEYFYYRNQFLSFEINNLVCLQEAKTNAFSIEFYFEEFPVTLQKFCTKEHILISVMPAINLVKTSAEPIVFDYTKLKYPLVVKHGTPPLKIYDVIEVISINSKQESKKIFPFPESLQNQHDLSWKASLTEKPFIEISLPPAATMQAEKQIIKASIWSYDKTFGESHQDYILQAASMLLPVKQIRSLKTSSSNSEWNPENDVLWNWINHIQFSFDQLQHEEGLKNLQEHLLMYFNPREPCQKELIKALLDLKIEFSFVRLTRDVYAIARVLLIDIVIDKSAFINHSVYLFGQMLETLFTYMTDIDVELQLKIVDQHQNICYRSKINSGTLT